MSHLLKLVDKLIGDRLRGNLFTDLNRFVNSPSGLGRDFSRGKPAVPAVPGVPLQSPFQQTTILSTPLQSPTLVTPSSMAASLKRPANADKHSPNVDPRPLNVNMGTIHPHADSKIIPSRQLHGPPSKPPNLSDTQISTQVDISAQRDNPAIKQSTISELAKFHNEVTKQVSSLQEGSAPPRPPTLERSANVLTADNRDNIASKFHSQREGVNTSVSRVEQLVAGGGPVQALKTNVEQQLGQTSNNLYGDNGYTAVQGPGGSILRFVDIVAGAKWLQNLSREGIPLPLSTPVTSEAIFKTIQWNVSQLALAFMNPQDTAGHGILNGIWNPLSLALSSLPLTRLTSVSNITLGSAAEDIGVAVGGNYQKSVMDSVTASPAGRAVKVVGERLLQMRQGSYIKSIDGNQIAQVRGVDAGFKGDIAATSYGGHPSIQAERSNSLLGAAISAVGSLIGGALPGAESFTIEDQVGTDLPLGSSVHGNIYNSNRPYNAINAALPLSTLEQKVEDMGIDGRNNEKVQSLKLDRLFFRQGFPGGSIDGSSTFSWTAKKRNFSDDGINPDADNPGINAATVDVEFKGEKLVEGSEPPDSEGIVVDDTLNDDDLYMPFMFQDLRDTTQTFLYFRAFLKPGSVSETFAPEWQQERYYGRVDKVATYLGTTRTINLSFDVVAFKPADLPVMYRKIEKLQSMVYPTYNLRGFLNAGPIIRMRVGDLFASDIEKGSGRGLPGYITNLDFSFDDGIWNIKTDFKVPRIITVTIGFNVVHNGNPGTYQHEVATVKPNGGKEGEPTGEATFGVAQFTPEGDNTTIKVSRGEMRRIFKTIRGSST